MEHLFTRDVLDSYFYLGGGYYSGMFDRGFCPIVKLIYLKAHRTFYSLPQFVCNGLH